MAYLQEVHKTLRQCLRSTIISIKLFPGNLNISVKGIFGNDHFCNFYIAANLLEIILKSLDFWEYEYDWNVFLDDWLNFG